MLHLKIDVKLFSISVSNLSLKPVRLGYLKNCGQTIKQLLFFKIN